ncbi:hypothetical protein DFP72DRAFT_903985 [Ephemerocybe angulata]|uniref:GTP binding protein 2 n=1 Tax=Ephemerocybe angulata TaxID=980116 RepID=A0A8H6HUL5_9AGAR|nr:hypothetical protein DFP72DRAFT_903985 [Tulosesus angulatus]
MFGESESESPRVPSPWDSLIANSASPSPIPRSRAHTPSPLAADLAAPLLPRLVPESDDGNVEYKLQLLNPSPARFARLVTQMKWRLLEGGGQAYYELGVADSGDLVGLPREDLEQTLETLEMMAGEIGASVIVVKEVEVPAVLARLSKRSGDRRRIAIPAEEEDTEDGAYSSSGWTEGSREASDEDDLSGTVVLEPSAGAGGVFTMDGEDVVTPKFAIDLEIASVFKPRPVRTKVHDFTNHLLVGGKAKRAKKLKHHNEHGHQDPEKKAQNRKQTRDKKREEKRKALVAMAAQSVEPGQAVDVSISASVPVAAPAQALLEVTAEAEEIAAVAIEDDVFGLPSSSTSKLHSFPTFAPSSIGESHLDVDPDVVKLAAGLNATAIHDSAEKVEDDDEKPRLIVEALVVRKMSLEEGFLDFGGFSIL